MNRFGKVLLVATSLTPIFFVCSLNSAIRSQWLATAVFVSLFILLVLILLFLMSIVRSKLPIQELSTVKVKPADKEVLAFLLSYLFPFFNRGEVDFSGEFFTATSVALVIGLIVYYSSAYTFNPVLALIGFHFYEVESNGMTYLLITKTHLNKPENKLIVKHLCDYVYIDEGKHGDNT